MTSLAEAEGTPRRAAGPRHPGAPETPSRQQADPTATSRPAGSPREPLGEAGGPADSPRGAGGPTGTPTPAPTRGRPRSEAVERAIVEGVMKLLEEGVPLAELSIERIARTAGVGKAAIYRRWSGKEELFVDVVRTAEPPDPALPGTSMRDDLVVLLESLRRRGLITRTSAILHNVYAQMKSSPKIWASYHDAVIAPRRRVGIEVLRRGRDSGELRADVDLELVNDLFVGAMLVRAIMRPDADLPEGLSEQIVDTLLEGLRPVSSPPVSSPTP